VFAAELSTECGAMAIVAEHAPTQAAKAMIETFPKEDGDIFTSPDSLESENTRAGAERTASALRVQVAARSSLDPMTDK
jgi:hypothetical protein